MEVKICTFYLHFFGKKDFYIARKSNIADVEIAFIGLFFILSNPVEFPCQPSLPTPVSLSVIPTSSLVQPSMFIFTVVNLLSMHLVSICIIGLSTRLSFIRDSGRYRFITSVKRIWRWIRIINFGCTIIYLFIFNVLFICLHFVGEEFPRGLMFAYIRLLMHFFLYISARENLCIFCGLSKKNAKYIYIICNDKTL